MGTRSTKKGKWKVGVEPTQIALQREKPAARYGLLFCPECCLLELRERTRGGGGWPLIVILQGPCIGSGGEQPLRSRGRNRLEEWMRVHCGALCLSSVSTTGLDGVRCVG